MVLTDTPDTKGFNGFDFIFSRQVEALGRAGDLLVGISTSGKSPNVIKAIESAQKMAIKTCQKFKAPIGVLLRFFTSSIHLYNPTELPMMYN